MGSDEWARQRKDNHKEVERRRRGNINEGITELGRIVPNGSGEKAKGAILSRAVQYIHHLKENEARNIEKWTLEKLLMDQAMGDLQAQLEEMRRLWEEERTARTRAESELDVLRGLKGSSASADNHATSASAGAVPEKASEASAPVAAAATTSASDGETTQGGEEESGRPGKRQRTD
jgi:bHLH factor